MQQFTSRVSDAISPLGGGSGKSRRLGGSHFSFGLVVPNAAKIVGACLIPDRVTDLFAALSPIPSLPHAPVASKSALWFLPRPGEPGLNKLIQIIQ
jgi:hypothetical protein